MNPMTKTTIIAALSLATLLNVGFAWQAFGDVTILGPATARFRRPTARVK